MFYQLRNVACVCWATPMFLVMMSPLPNNFGHYILHYCSVKFCSDLKLATKWGSDMDESVEMANQVTESSISPVGGYDQYCLQICIPAYYLTTYFLLLPDVLQRSFFYISKSSDKLFINIWKKRYAKSVMTSYLYTEHSIIWPHLSKSSFKRVNKQA